MLSQGHMLAPLYHYTSQVFPSFGNLSGSLEECKNCHNVMVEADIHLRPLQTSILVIYKVFETLVCCLNCIWLHSYTITLAKFSQVLGIQVHLRSGKTAIRSWLRLTSTSNHFIHPYQSYTKCLRHWYAVSMAYVCTLIITLAKLPPDLENQVHLRSRNDATTSWLRLTSTSNHFIHPYQTCTKC